MIKKISDKDKQDWQNFLNSSDKLENKDQKISSTPIRYIERSIDLHGYTLEEANQKITSYIETSDYRLVLNLEGICRFVLNERNITPGGYYQASINCDDYINDLLDVEPHIYRNSLIQKYSNYFKMKKLEIDKEVLSETSNHQIVSTLTMLAPFNKIDKQAILESPNIQERINTINSILDLNTFQVVGRDGPNQLN